MERGRRICGSPEVGASVGLAVATTVGTAVPAGVGKALGDRERVGAEFGTWAGASVGLGKIWPSFSRKPLPLMKVVALHEPM